MFSSYWLAIIGVAACWLSLFIFRPGLRADLIGTSVLVTPFVLVDYFLIPGYWIPHTWGNTPVGIEGFLFTFFLSGLAGVVYGLVSCRRPPRFHPGTRILPRLVAPLFGCFFLSWLIVSWLRLNPIYFVILSLLGGAGVVVWLRPDLKQNVFLSSILFGVFYLISFLVWLVLSPQAAGMWSWASLSGFAFVGKMPIEEVVFGFSFGALIGPIYEFISHDRSVSPRAG